MSKHRGTYVPLTAKAVALYVTAWTAITLALGISVFRLADLHMGSTFDGRVLLVLVLALIAMWADAKATAERERHRD